MSGAAVVLRAVAEDPSSCWAGAALKREWLAGAWGGQGQGSLSASRCCVLALCPAHTEAVDLITRVW